jgi:hypothetical protein
MEARVAHLRKGFRPAVAVVFALVVLGLFAGPASASTFAVRPVGPVAARQLPSAALASSSLLGHPAVTPLSQAAPATTTATPNFNQQVTNANRANATNKLAVGITALVLLVIVYFGRRLRNRHTRRLKNLQNAKS